MRLVLRTIERESIGSVITEAGDRPPRVTTDRGREVVLDWEGTFDDQHHLRRCPVCGCDLLYRHRRLPRVMGLVLVLALALGLAAILGLWSSTPLMIAMGIAVALDLGILLLSPESINCYRCRSSFRGFPIAPYLQRWSLASEKQVLHRKRRSAGRSNADQ